MGTKGQSFILVGLPFGGNEEGGCQPPGWGMEGLEVDFPWQIKVGLFAYSGFSFLGKTWPCVNGVLVKEEAGMGPWGLMQGRGIEAFIASPAGSLACPNLRALW